jgi:hypothetical protein
LERSGEEAATDELSHQHMREGLPGCGRLEPAEEVGHQRVRETSAALFVDGTADVSARHELYGTHKRMQEGGSACLELSGADDAVESEGGAIVATQQRPQSQAATAAAWLAEACFTHSMDSTAVGAARHEFHGTHQHMQEDGPGPLEACFEPSGEEAATEELSHQRMREGLPGRSCREPAVEVCYQRVLDAAVVAEAAVEAATAAAAAAATAVCSFQRMREELAEALAADATLAQRDQPTQRCRHCERKTLSLSWNTNTSRSPGYARWCDGSCRTYFQSGKAWRCNGCELQYCKRCVNEGAAVKRP